MGIIKNLLINGSLVRAQQAEPYNQGLTVAKDGRSVLNLELGSKPPSKTRRRKVVCPDQICNVYCRDAVLSSAHRMYDK